MTLASFLLGLVIATIFGSAFHFWRGGSLKWLITFNIFALIGFWAGHLVAKFSDIKFIELGPIHLGPAILGTITFLFIGYWLSMAGKETRKK